MQRNVTGQISPLHQRQLSYGLSHTTVPILLTKVFRFLWTLL